jgi:hypothetical protein
MCGARYASHEEGRSGNGLLAALPGLLTSGGTCPCLLKIGVGVGVLSR